MNCGRHTECDGYYGQKVAATSGPLPGDYEIRGSDFVMSFKHSDGGLVAKGGELQGFEIAGADMQWSRHIEYCQQCRSRIEEQPTALAWPKILSEEAWDHELSDT